MCLACCSARSMLNKTCLQEGESVKMEGNDDVEHLAFLVAQLKIADEKRTSDEMDMPDENVVWKFENLACTILRIKRGVGRSDKEISRKIVAHFGAPVIVIAKLWELLQEHGNLKCEEFHLFWGLARLKLDTSEEAMVSLVKGERRTLTAKTFRTWSWLVIFELENLAPLVVSPK